MQFRKEQPDPTSCLVYLDTKNTVVTSKGNISIIMPSHPCMVMVNYLYKFIPSKERALQLTATCQRILLFILSLNAYKHCHLLLYRRICIDSLQVEAPLNALASVFVLILTTQLFQQSKLWGLLYISKRSQGIFFNCSFGTYVF